MAYGNGFPSPEWMGTFESIHAAAELTNQRVQFLVENNDGYMVSVAEDRCNVEDRMGALYVRPLGPAKVGDVMKKLYQTHTYDGTKHLWTVPFVLMREVPDKEVKELWSRCLLAPRPPIMRDGWFEALTD